MTKRKISARFGHGKFVQMDVFSILFVLGERLSRVQTEGDISGQNSIQWKI